MALNTRQAAFIGRLREVCNTLEEVYDEFYSLSQTFTEEFDAGKDNDLSTHTEELAEWGLTFLAIDRASNQLAEGVIKLWTGQAITTREYGKFARRVAD